VKYVKRLTAIRCSQDHCVNSTEHFAMMPECRALSLRGHRLAGSAIRINHRDQLD